jgi:DNA-binding transcriptional ArsR family regulator
MDADAQVAPVALLVADATRSTILWALSDGRALPACELALRAGVTAATISYHVDKLIDGGLVSAERQGRHRYRLANPAVVGVLESLAALAPPAPARTYREGKIAKALRFGRTCYDHLAGRMGVEITEALVRRNALVVRDREYELTLEGERFLTGLGVDVEGARQARRIFARTCLDWSERRHHLAGALGSALLGRLFKLQWIERTETRAVRLSDRGRSGLCEELGIEV